MGKDHLFKPGTTGNPAGRTPGSQNKLTRLTREIMALAVDQHKERFIEVIGEMLNAKSFYARVEGAKIYRSLLPTKIDITSDGEPLQMNLNLLTAEELLQFHALAVKAKQTIHIDGHTDNTGDTETTVHGSSEV